MVSRIFISWICHFWARFWLNFNFGDFRADFGYFSLVKIDFFEIYFQSWRIKLRVLKFFRPILIIKRHQKNTQAKLFEKFASRQHALMTSCRVDIGSMKYINFATKYFWKTFFVPRRRWLRHIHIHSSPASLPSLYIF